MQPVLGMDSGCLDFEGDQEEGSGCLALTNEIWKTWKVSNTKDATEPGRALGRGPRHLAAHLRHRLLRSPASPLLTAANDS